MDSLKKESTATIEESITEPLESMDTTIEEAASPEESVENSFIAEPEKKDENSLDKTMVLPDIKKEIAATEPVDEEETISILTADTIDLSDAIHKVKETEMEDLVPEDRVEKDSMIQAPKKAEPKKVQDALVVEPVDAKPVKPLDADLNPASVKKTEVLEPIPENTKETPTLDSLLQSMNMSKKKKNKKGQQQDEDPFEFLGSVDDF